MARILLADDDRGSLDFVRRALEMDGHVVVPTQDGSEALDKLKSDGQLRRAGHATCICRGWTASRWRRRPRWWHRRSGWC